MSKKKEPSIRLSEKHGLNPTLGLCFFCGKETGEIALLGKIKGDAEAPRMAVLNYNPCKACQETFDRGYLLIGCQEEQPEDKRPPIRKNPDMYPTGGYALITKEAASRWGLPEGKLCLVPHKMISDLTAQQE